MARHDLGPLLSSGFEAGSTNRASGPLGRPTIHGCVNDVSGVLVVRGTSVLNARSYQVRASTDGGKTWTTMAVFNGSRRMLVQPVTPGTDLPAGFCGGRYHRFQRVEQPRQQHGHLNG